MTVFSAVARFSAVDKFSGVLSKMEERNRKFAASSSNAFKKVEQDANRLKGSLGGISGQLKSMVGIASIATLAYMAGDAIVKFDDSMASLSAVTGVSGKALENMQGQVLDLATKSKMSASEIANGFQTVGSAMSQYLSDPKALGQITEAGVLLAKASRMQVQPALEALTGAMNQFNLGAESANQTVQQLTAGEIVGQVSTQKSVDALSKFGAVANSMNTTLPESIALIQVLGKKLPTEELGTASRNLLLFMDTSKGASSEAMEAFKRNGVSLDVLSDKTLSTADRLRELSKIQNDSVAMSKIFGKENITAGKVIFDQLGTYEDWVKQIENTSKAEEQAAKNSATIANKIKELKNAFDNAIVGATQGSVGISMFTGVLGFLANNLSWIIGLIAAVASVLIPMYLAYKLVTLGTLAYNVALAAQAIIAGKGAIALKGNVIALKAYRSMVYVATAAQWAWNAAMTANPIGLIVVAIVAVIAVIVLLVKYWDDLKAKFMAAPTWVKAALMPFIIALAPILMLVNAIKKLWDSWEAIKNSFANGGFLEGLKKIGAVLLSSLIDPMMFFLKMLSKIPGLGGVISPIMDKLGNFQAGLDATGSEFQTPPEAVNTQATQNEVTNTQINESRQNVDININDPKNRSTVSGSPGGIPIKVNGTSNAF